MNLLPESLNIDFGVSFALFKMILKPVKTDDCILSLNGSQKPNLVKGSIAVSK